MFGFVEIYEPHGGPHMKPARAKPFPRPLGGFSNSGHEPCACGQRPIAIILTRQVFEIAIFLSPQKPTAGEEKPGVSFPGSKSPGGSHSRAGRLRPATPAAAGSGGGMHRTRFQKEKKNPEIGFLEFLCRRRHDV